MKVIKIPNEGRQYVSQIIPLDPKVVQKRMAEYKKRFWEELQREVNLDYDMEIV